MNNKYEKIFDTLLEKWISDHAFSVTNPDNTYQEISVISVKDLYDLVEYCKTIK